MSIIHDALKKVQQMNPEKATDAPRPPQPPVNAPDIKPADKMNIPLLVAATCAVVAMIFAALPQIMPKQQPAPAAAPVTTVAEPVKKAAVPERTTPSTSALARAVSGAVAVPVVPASGVSAPAEQPTQQAIDPLDPLGNIHIEGVIDMGGKKAVLINGNVYEEGQTIRGKIISEVTFETLTIMDDGRKRIFPIKP